MIAASEKSFCRCLKTKMLYVGSREDVDFHRPSSTAQYWCLHTMSQAGLDGDLVVPDACIPGRPCFESEDR